VLPEVEVFLGETPIAIYETPGGQKFADSVLPVVKDCNTILLANHGTVTFGPDLEKAYFNTEIIDAYCRILILAKQLGRVHYFSEKQTKELLDLKKRLGYDDVRFRDESCELCGPSVFNQAYPGFELEPFAFPREEEEKPAPARVPSAKGHAGNGRAGSAADVDMDELVKRITDQVIAALGAGV
jgi:L-fuculose-phosphate aldolase